MAIMAKSASGTIHLPSSGLHKAVLCDVHDLGWNETQWGDKHHVLLVFEIDEDHPEFGGPFRVNKRYNLSLHEKATLSQDLESWRGKAFTKTQRKEGIDLEQMIGQNALINIIHNETDNGSYANIKAILPLPKDQQPLEISRGYVRIKDREDDEEEERTEPEEPASKERYEGDNFGAEWDEDELPF